jgi:sugar lactone lactonase YvrE
VGTIAAGRIFLESPRWHNGRFWASDVQGRAVIAISPDGEVEELSLDEEPGGLGWMPEGDLLVVSWSGRRLLRISGGRILEHAALATLMPGQTNDLVVDAAGRAFVGSTGFSTGGTDPIRPGAIARIDPDGSARIVADDLFFPNGMVIMSDGRTLIVSETLAQRLTAFTIDDDGSLVARRDWARIGDPPASDNYALVRSLIRFAPDGITADEEGCIWIADPVGLRTIRMREGGEILEELSPTEGLGPYSCALGGFDGKTLAICENGPIVEGGKIDFAAAGAQRVSRLTTHQVSVTHAGRP